MLEIFAGLLAFFLGWLCLSHVNEVRALFSDERSRSSLCYGLACSPLSYLRS